MLSAGKYTIIFCLVVGNILNGTERLTSDERLYLHAARTGDLVLLQELLETPDLKLNFNCIDYMGRNSLHLAVDAENIEMVEFLIAKMAWECIEESLLHAISKGFLTIVRLIVDHPNYVNDERDADGSKKDQHFRKEEKYQYPPDITPLILAAHQDDHEMVQLFLSRGYTIERPHAIHCQCPDCSFKQETDSLKRSRSRLNAYMALSSPAYMALSSPDPITTTFELRQEMKAVAQVEKEFKKDYLALVDQCMDFACECMNLCRGTQEMEAIMGDDAPSGIRDPLARLRMAVHYEEKRFVAHANTQQHMTNLWYGNDMLFLQGTSWQWKLLMFIVVPPVLPFVCILYIINPNTKIARMMRCPVSKFINHTVSHFIFLILLGVATFGLEDMMWAPGQLQRERDGVQDNVIEKQLLLNMRPARYPITHIQMLIIFWIVGNMCLECKQIYTSGAKEHFMHYYNYMDFMILAFYLASYSLRFATLFRLHKADISGNYTARAREALHANNNTEFFNIIKESKEPSNNVDHYFMSASRFDWMSGDPEIIADVLFAIANLLSFARTTYVMPSHELLGPLQISLGRMFNDIARFFVLFLLVLVAFMVGMTNLYRYYGTHMKDSETRASESFKGLPQTVYTLFFSIFGLIALDKLKIQTPDNNMHAENNFARDSTKVVDSVGLFLFAMFQVAVTIVLVNMLIAMMSHSFEAIQGDNDVEWKYARTKLWLSFVDEGSTLPVPFNTIPTPKTFRYGFKSLKDLFGGEKEEEIVYDFSRRRENVLITGLDKAGLVFNSKTTYSEIIQRLMRRYLFKMDRVKKERLRVGEANDPGGYGDMLEEEDDVKSSTASVDDMNKKNGDIVKIVEENDFTVGDVFLQLPRVDMRFARSDQDSRSTDKNFMLTDHKRKSTLTRNRTVRKQTPSHCNDQLDSLQRTQRLIEARLQDLQMQGRQAEGPVKMAVEKVQAMVTENHRAIMSLLGTMQLVHADLILMSQAFRDYASLAGGSSTVGSGVGGHGGGKAKVARTKQTAYHQRSEPGALATVRESPTKGTTRPLSSTEEAIAYNTPFTPKPPSHTQPQIKPKHRGFGTWKMSLSRGGRKAGGGGSVGKAATSASAATSSTGKNTTGSATSQSPTPPKYGSKV